jgi:hypothetical protein
MSALHEANAATQSSFPMSNGCVSGMVLSISYSDDCNGNE